MLRVIAAASAPLLINVGSGRVCRGGSSSSTGTPVTLGGGGGNTETVVVTGCDGRPVLPEKTCEDVEAGEKGEASDVVEVDHVEVTIVVDGLVTCGGATAPIPRDVGVCMRAGEELDVELLDDV